MPGFAKQRQRSFANPLLRDAGNRRSNMRRSFSLALATGALALGFAAAPVQAAPLTSSPGDLRTVTGESSGIEQVRHRCYRHRGHWHCPEHRHYRHYDEPGFRFYFGPRRHYHRRHWDY
jgi:hypothetical protein